MGYEQGKRGSYARVGTFIKREMERVYLLLGTNLGEKEINLNTAVSLLIGELAPKLGSEVQRSSIYESEPFGFESQDNFLNQVIAFDIDIVPQELLKVCKYVEERMGRILEAPKYDSDGKRIYKSRLIDIDILLFGERVVQLPDLQIPHPRIAERDFTYIPLREICPNCKY